MQTGNNTDTPNGAHIHRGTWNETFETHILGEMRVKLDLTLQKQIQLSIKVMTLHASDFHCL